MALTADPVSTGVVDLVFRRTYAASPARVWAAWTDPARFARWFGPHDATMDPCELDVRPGGRLFFCHRHPAFGEVWVRGAYLVVERPVRLVLAFEFADAAGHSQSRGGLAGGTRARGAPPAPRCRANSAGTRGQIRRATRAGSARTTRRWIRANST